jgi:predicted DNA binding CopG/RHH family protein
MQWNISREKVCLIITDNGSNMVRALKCLNERLEEKEDEEMQQVEQCEVEEAQQRVCRQAVLIQHGQKINEMST